VYFDENSTSGILTALDELTTFINHEGPYDGIIAFSLGAALASTWMIDRIQRNIPIPFKCAVFFSAAMPVSVDSLRNGQAVDLDPAAAGEVIGIPTAHLWGTNDWLATSASKLSEMCWGPQRSVFVHNGGHEVPASGDDLIKAVNTIRRCIVWAEQGETAAPN